jgi:glucan phosphoethanolaminetransferase (alkaline phosphatase superfamily)
LEPLRERRDMKPRMRQGWRTPFLTTAIKVFLTFALLLAPDLLLGFRGYQPGSMSNLFGLAVLAALSFLITVMPSRRGRIALILALGLGQLIGLECLQYFGDVLRPDQLMLAINEAADTALGIGARTMLFVPPAAIEIAIAAALLCLHGSDTRWPALHIPGSGVVAGLVLAGLVGSAAFAGNATERATGGVGAASALGTYEAAIAALRFAFAKPSAPPGVVVTKQVTETKPVAERAATVAVIMGESINPLRMSLFGAPSDTTPDMNSWRKHPPAGFRLYPRIGISAGVATLASVPTFLKPAAMPVDGAAQGIQLYERASEGGFKSWYFSAQHSKFLTEAGGAAKAVRVVTADMAEMAGHASLDDHLVALLHTVPAADRNFIFLHQRVNHEPYQLNCAHVPELARLDTAGMNNGDKRRAEYDLGLKCWDRNVAALVADLVARPGPVYIFITGDHSELMGEDGLWGHMHPVLRNALVPVMLLTNRPDSEVARQFAAMPVPSFYNMSRMVALALGTAISTPDFPDDVAYINHSLPFARGGYLQAKRESGWRFAVRSFAPNGVELSAKTEDFADVAKAEAFATQ